MFRNIKYAYYKICRINIIHLLQKLVLIYNINIRYELTYVF